MPKQAIYFECNSGISGDMTVAALLDLGADEGKLRKVLASLPVGGYEVRVSRIIMIMIWSICMGMSIIMSMDTMTSIITMSMNTMMSTITMNMIMSTNTMNIITMIMDMERSITTTMTIIMCTEGSLRSPQLSMRAK